MVSPPHTRQKTKSLSDGSGATSDVFVSRKRRHDSDVSSLLTEVETLKAVCTNTFQMVDNLKVLIQKILEENVAIKTELISLKSLYATVTAGGDNNHSNTQASSYAHAVKSNPVVVIKPKNVKQPNETTKKDLIENMSPTSSKFCGVRNVSNGGLAIECESVVGSNILLKDASNKLGENYVVTIPSKRPTKVRIIGMSEQISSEKILEKIVAQNPEIFHFGYSVEVVSTFKVKDRFGAKLVVDSDSFDRLIASSKLRLGWDICRVHEAFDLVRCYNCSGYHHLSKNCTAKKQCPKCAGEHTLIECESSIEKCCNCAEAAKSLNLVLRTDHSALSSDCPVYIRKINSQRRRTNYKN